MTTITEQENGASVRGKLNRVLGVNVSVVSAAYTLVADDHDKLIAVDSLVDVIISVPAGLPADFRCTIAQMGLGEVTVVGSSATVNSFDGINTLIGQYSVAQLYCTNTNAFLLVIQGATITPEEPPPPVTTTDTTSAGVFDSSGMLVRTLWSAEVNNPYITNPASAWDGTLDDGSVAASGTYTVKLLYHNCTYTWEGVIGNTSPDHTTLRYWNDASPVVDMEIHPDGKMWYASGYHERLPVMGYSNVSDVQNMDYGITIGFRASYSTMNWVTTDGTITYYAHYDADASTFVAGVSYTAHTFINFPSGITWQGIAGVAIANEAASATNWISSIAVQRTGSYLYIARPQAKLQTLNKTSGAILQNNVTFTEPTLVEVNPNNDDLWLCHKVAGVWRITKCAVDGSGNVTLTATQTTATITTPRSMNISHDGTRLLLVDAGTHQIKAFNTSDASLRSSFGTSGAFGTSGGYAADPTVTNTKFMFEAMSIFGGGNGWVAHAPDGSFWVGDTGNYRHLHFSSGDTPTYIERVMYIPGFYKCGICRGDPTRVFVDFLEFTIDYDIALGIDNGSWTLAKNWGYSFPNNVSQFTRLKHVGVYSNSKTYGCVDHRWYELTATGLRDTGVDVNQNSYIDENMNAYFTLEQGILGAYGRIALNPFTGFDGSDNPTWTYPVDWSGAFDVYLLTVDLPSSFPHIGAWDANLAQYNYIEPTENGIIPFSDPNGLRGWTGTAYTAGINHFGGLDATTGEPKFNTYATGPNNHGGGGNRFLLYPPIPFYPTNGVNQNSGGVFTYEPGEAHVFVGTCGEGGWGNNQINIWHHYHDSGLLMGRFGVPAPYFASLTLTNPDTLGDGVPNSQSSFKAMNEIAGNTRWGGHALINGTYYLYQNDEWYHGGLHRWKITGTAATYMTEQEVVWDSGDYTAPAADPSDLLEGLPFDTSPITTGTAGWTRTPTTDTPTDISNGPWLKVLTNVIVCDRRQSPDIALEATWNNASPAWLSRTVPRVGTGNWTLDALLYLTSGDDNHSFPTSFFWVAYEILDNTGKVILTLHNFIDVFNVKSGCKVNGIDLMTPLSNTDAWRFKTEKEVPLTVVANIGAGNMNVTYGEESIVVTPFEVGASLTNIAAVRLVYRPRSDGSFGQCAGCISRLIYTEV